MQKIETSYAKHRIVNREEHKMLYYECNRSDAYGYKPNYKVRTEKSGGSIRIKGVCPSRLVCKLRNQGQVSVSYWKTHVGHNEELRTMHLSKAEEKMIVEKVTSGVPHSRILEDSRKMETPKLGRLPLLTSIDLRNLSRKYNIHKKPDQNDMVATDLKVKEWNDNKNYVLLLKMEDDAASCLGETSIIKLGHEEEINDFVRGKLEQRNVIQEETKEEEEILRLQKEELKNFIDELDNDSFTKFMRNIQGTMCKMKEELQEKARNITKKRKMEKQYFVRIKKFKNCSLVFYLVCNSYFKGRNVLESCGRDSGTLEILIKN
ncbi:uncharacterized protein LOC126885657 isoform X2 [Diabrotica virgifera virgifera]|nr:uncharacterized protein LOC126885657 isoform X2 [Diabrotica virgifera virgifera]XP_050508300.1 uncharacterized protein LOC126885657 isoform X2 [Diabrotica virgifera virgifera]XP_050508302.1 uncharacterized protein LOC126885657 isoform X2 [Diabrotica virgifera virgifera]XP_050508303.1 uncharacterized protein LOC126885657 isoform X2 [Diabrotica virgifera virgifera]